MASGVSASSTTRESNCRFLSIITALLNFVVGLIRDQRMVVPEIHSALVVIVGICPRVSYLASISISFDLKNKWDFQSFINFTHLPKLLIEVFKNEQSTPRRILERETTKSTHQESLKFDPELPGDFVVDQNLLGKVWSVMTWSQSIPKVSK